MKKRAIYPGTFDPITNGHLDLVRRAVRIFDEVIIAVAPSHKKKPLFTLQERLPMINFAIRGIKGVTVESFEGLLVEPEYFIKAVNTNQLLYLRIPQPGFQDTYRSSFLRRMVKIPILVLYPCFDCLNGS